MDQLASAVGLVDARRRRTIDRSVAGLGDAVFGQFGAGNFAADPSSREYQHAVADLGQLLGVRTGADDRHASAAAARRAAKICRRVPTSTPCVGSSSSSSCGVRFIQRAIRTFWALPPESAESSAAGSLGRTSKRVPKRARLAHHGAAPQKAARKKRSTSGSNMLSTTDRLSTPLAFCRSPGSRAKSSAMRPVRRHVGERDRRGRSANVSVARTGTAARRRQIRHLLVAGADQAGQTQDLASADAKSVGSQHPPARSSMLRERPHASTSVVQRLGAPRQASADDHARRPGRGSRRRFRVRRRPAVAQHVMRSVMAMTSSISCEMKMTLEPVAAIDRIRPNSLSTPSRGRKGVGSSSSTRPGLPVAAHSARISSKARTMASSARSTGESRSTRSSRIDGRGRSGASASRGRPAFGAPVDEGRRSAGQMREAQVFEHGERRARDQDSDARSSCRAGGSRRA